MRKPILGYAAFFLLALGVFLVASLPAAFVLERIDLPPTIRIETVHGTVWTGEAATADATGPLGRIVWNLDFWPLLAGTVGGDLRFDGPLGEAHGHVAFDDGSIRVRDLALSLDVFAISSRPPALFPVHGQLIGTIRQARLDRTGLHLLEGPLSLQQSGITFPMELALGNYMADFNTEDGTIIGNITSSEEPLSASGRVTLSGGSRYQVELTLRPAADADPALRDALAMIGRPRADGSVPLNYRGDLRRWLGNPAESTSRRAD